MIKLRISVPVVGLALFAVGCGDPVEDTTNTNATGSVTTTTPGPVGSVTPGATGTGGAPVGNTGVPTGNTGLGPTGTTAGPTGPTAPTGNTTGPSGNTSNPAATTGPSGNTSSPTPTTSASETTTAPTTPAPVDPTTPVEPPPPASLPPDGVVTSAQGGYWTTGALTEGTGNATVTVSQTEAQTWEGFGGAFNESGWSKLSSAEMKQQAITLLFSADEGANFAWGRIPMGASDYALDRYTLADTGTDVTPNSGESNRPPVDLELASFSLDRDGELLIPFIKAAQAEKPELRFWASPWTPPSWMKTGYKEDSAGNNPVKPSYFDGGNMKGDQAILAAYADYFAKFVEGYAEQGIEIEVVAPQNEPGYEQNYPSCLWDGTTFKNFISQHLGPKMQALGVKVMLGTLSNSQTDLAIGQAVTGDATAKSFVSMAGVQWGVLDSVNSGTGIGGLPIWATEHKCGNYPWQGGYVSSQAPNDHAYAVESWGYIRDSINRGKVTSYNAWNMVLDRLGKGNDFARDWNQNALLVADGGRVNPTPTYYVFRHMSQYVAPGAKVLGTSGDAVAFKNPDGSLVAVVYNSGGANANYTVAMGGKTFQLNMPGSGWATVKFTP